MRTQNTVSPGTNKEASRQTEVAWIPCRRDCLVVILIFAAAFVAYALIWPQAPLQSLDSPTYMRLAREIKAGNITELPLRTPGFPILLILTGSEAEPTRLLFYVSLFLHFTATGLLAYLLYRLGIDRRLILAMVLIASLPPYLEASAFADSDNLCGFMVVVTMVSAAFWRMSGRRTLLWIFAAGALATALVRPTYQFLVLAMAAAVFAAHLAGIGKGGSLLKLTKAMAVPILVSVCGLGGYAAYNYARFGYFDVSAMTPYTLSTKTASFVECLPDEYSDIRQILMQHRDRELLTPFEDHTAQKYIHRAMPEIIQLFGNDQVRALLAVKRANIYLISHRPMSYLIESLKSLTTYWLPMEYGLSNGDSAVLRAFWAALQMAVVFLLLSLAIVMAGGAAIYLGLRIWIRLSPSLLPRTTNQLVTYLLGMTIIGYSALISCFAGMGIPRYRVTSNLVILACCLLGLTLFWRLITYLGALIKRSEA